MTSKTQAPGDEPSEIRYVYSDDSGSATESPVVGKTDPSGSQGICIVRGIDGRRATADMSPSGEISWRIEGGPPSAKVPRELRTAQELVNHLIQEGGSWGDIVPEPQCAKAERGVDVTAQNDTNEVLEIQVTVVAPSETWAKLRLSPHVAEGVATLESAVQDIYDAITRKEHHPREHIVLALDATDAVASALYPVVDVFRAQHGLWAAGLGYEAIWLVGPTSFVTRLDNP